MHAVGIFESTDSETQMVDAYLLISRIYQVTQRRDMQERTADYCAELLTDVREQSNLETLLRIVLLPMLSDLPPSLAGNFTRFIQSIPSYNNANQADAVKFLRSLIKNGKFVEKLHTYLNYAQNLEEIIRAIRKNGMLSRWRGLPATINTDGEEFIAMIESLVYLIGEDFLVNALNQPS